MDVDIIWKKYWEMLHDDISAEDDIRNLRPLLAHYTSLQNLENILSNEELWLSNPLNMNDWEEVRFGVNNGHNLVHLHKDLKRALDTEDRRRAFYQALDNAYTVYANQHVLDLYIMCFSLHSPSDVDGRLSMWRGYGNAGKGAAIIFDTSKVTIQEVSPLALGPVIYATQKQRIEHIQNKISQTANFINENAIPDDYVAALANALFQRICLYAVFSKHIGFEEEKEWRLVYLKDRDPERQLSRFLGYFNGSEGIQSKLKLPTKPIDGAISDDFVLSSIVHSIIVGPTSSSPLTMHSIERMLEDVGKPELKSTLRMSTIPFRA